jgi:hypothetical protein
MISISLSIYAEWLASGRTSLLSAIKKPADKVLESVAMIFPLKFTIFSDFIVFIPAGPEAPGIMTDEDDEEDDVGNMALCK